MPETLIIVGASARAAAQSAVRAGYRVWAADLFADADLRACAETVEVRDYPRGLQRALAEAPPGDWLYTGALENQPRQIRRMSRARRLLGCTDDVVRGVRRPQRLSEAIRSAGLLYPDTRLDGLPAEEPGRWLAKPFRSAGGTKVRFADPRDVRVTALRSNYFQRFVDGVPCSAVYVADGKDSQLLGATRQLIGCDWTGATGFQYCGSIGPLAVSDGAREQIERIGRCIVERFSLVGLIGVDFVLAGDEVWTLEVNPRYTASVEVLERSLGIRAIASHVAACRDGKLVVERVPSTAPPADAAVTGKAIVFARAPLTVLPALTQHLLAISTTDAPPHFADIPNPGTKILPHQPLFTCFAEGPTCDAVEASLRTNLLEVEQLLAST